MGHDNEHVMANQSNTMYINVRLKNGRQENLISMLVDTGSSRSIISYSALIAFGKRNMPKIDPRTTQLKGANGSELQCLGNVTFEVKLGNEYHIVKFTVVNELITTAILGSTTHSMQNDTPYRTR